MMPTDLAEGAEGRKPPWKAMSRSLESFFDPAYIPQLASGVPWDLNDQPRSLSADLVDAFLISVYERQQSMIARGVDEPVFRLIAYRNGHGESIPAQYSPTYMLTYAAKRNRFADAPSIRPFVSRSRGSNLATNPPPEVPPPTLLDEPILADEGDTLVYDVDEDDDELLDASDDECDSDDILPAALKMANPSQVLSHVAEVLNTDTTMADVEDDSDDGDGSSTPTTATDLPPSAPSQPSQIAEEPTSPVRPSIQPPAPQTPSATRTATPTATPHATPVTIRRATPALTARSTPVVVRHATPVATARSTPVPTVRTPARSIRPVTPLPVSVDAPPIEPNSNATVEVVMSPPKKAGSGSSRQSGGSHRFIPGKRAACEAPNTAEAITPVVVDDIFGAMLQAIDPPPSTQSAANQAPVWASESKAKKLAYLQSLSNDKSYHLLIIWLESLTVRYTNSL